MILANNSDGKKAYALPHETYCLSLGWCVCAPVFGHARASVITFEEKERRLVPRAVLAVPEIAQAIRRGRLRVTGHGP